MKRVVRPYILFIVVLFVALLLALPTPSRSQGPGDAPPSGVQSSTWAEIQSALQSQGSVGVIVGLNMPFTPEGQLASAQAANAQQADIQRMQTGLLSQLGGQVTVNARFQFIPHMALTVDQAAFNQLIASPLINSIELDRQMEPALWYSNWLIGSPAAWTIGYDGFGWTVAVLDTGVDKNHPFLSGKIVSEACYSNPQSSSNESLCPGGVISSTATNSGLDCSTTISGCGHGTHVAGIAAGRTVTFNDGGTTRTFSGVAPYANVIAIKVFHRVNTSTVCGSSTPCVRTWESDWILGLERVYALRNTYSIAAANMSLGGGGYTTNCTGPTSSIVSTLRSAGIATVIAAGNNSYINGTSYPACIADAINVGSTNWNDEVSSFSNAANFMNMWAPGGSILSSRAGTYQYLGGTSMAAPHVAGAWAVLKQRFPGTSVTGILNQITSTGVPVKDNRGGGTVTKPRLQLDNALYGRSGGMTNSLRSNAKIIPDGTVYSVGQTMNGSLKAIDDPVPSCQSSFDNTVWYRITPSVSGSTTISTLYSNFDTVIAVYVGSTQVACNDDYSGSLTSQVTLNMTAGTTYEIMIAKYGSAFASNVNGTLELQVIRTAHKPTQIGPSGLYTVSLSPIYRWNALPGATAYQVYVYDFVTGAVPVNATYTASSICIAGTCSVNAGVNLVSNRSYAWWVAARYDIYSTAAWGPWSNGLNFIPSIAPGKPTTISPTGIITGTLTPAYRWSDVGGAVSYALLVYDMETFAVKIFTSYTASSICSAGFCQVTPTGSANTLINGRAYGWFVAALSYAGASQWSDGKVFIPFVTPSAPTLISPTGTATNPVTYRWNKVQGVTAYYVLVLRSTGTQYVGTWVSATSVCGATTCQYTPGGSLPVGTYFWWVASGNPAGTSGYSSSLAFSITSAPSPAPTFEPAQDFNP